MADMIDAKEAKALLGCDDAALNNHINGGAIRAQRVGGKLQLNRDDVEKLARAEGDEGTIVLTGDSDELSIDLGKVVDDASETIVQPRKDTNASESITFGDELEVVSFDDPHARDVAKASPGVASLNFTDSNTAVMTAVEETQVGATTAPIDFQTSQIDAGSSNSNVGSSSRRSVRSSRAKAEIPTVHWIWPTLMTLTLIVGLALVLPYYFLAMSPYGVGEKDAAGGTRRGLDDNAWTNMASTLAGFTVEPNEKRFKERHPDGGEYIDIRKERDTQADWRFTKYQNGMAGKGERLKSFVITEVVPGGKQVKAGATTYPVVEGEKYQVGTETFTEQKVDLGWKDSGSK